MSITPYKGNEVTVWRPHRLGQYLSFHTHRMYYFLKNVAPVLVKHEVRQIGRDAVDVIPFISSDAKRDIKRWLGDYDPRHFSSTFHSVWADFDVIDHGTKGMAIHFSFSVAGLKDLCCEAAIYFYYEGGARLQDFNGLYGSYDGQVAVSSDFTPDYHNTIYGDFSIFMPYSELHMAPGKHDLAYLIQLYSKSNLVEEIQTNMLPNIIRWLFGGQSAEPKPGAKQPTPSSSSPTAKEGTSDSRGERGTRDHEYRAIGESSIETGMRPANDDSSSGPSTGLIVQAQSGDARTIAQSLGLSKELPEDLLALASVNEAFRSGLLLLQRMKLDDDLYWQAVADLREKYDTIRGSALHRGSGKEQASKTGTNASSSKIEG